MERWRWLPEDLGRRHIRVNIADYRVEVWEQGKVALEMKAVVGREYRATPMFSASMTYVVLSPYWHVPPVIAALDKLPVIRRNPGYLAEQRMTLFSNAVLFGHRRILKNKSSIRSLFLIPGSFPIDKSILPQQKQICRANQILLSLKHL